MKRTTARRIPHEVADDPAPPDPNLARLHAMQRLQQLRRAMAEAEALRARQNLAEARQVQSKLAEGLARREQDAQRKRGEHRAASIARASSIAELRRRRHAEFAMLAAIEQHRRALCDQDTTVLDAEERLDEAVRKRRRSEVRGEKFAQLIAQLSETA